MLGSRTHVLDRPPHLHGEAGDIGSPPYETNSVAPKDTLAHPRVLGEDHPDSPILSPPPAVVVKGGERSVRSTFAPPSSHSSDLYRRIKRRLGRTFRRLYRKRYLVSAGKQTGIESGFASPKSLRTPLPQSGSPGCYGQYHRGSLHQQRRRHAFGIPMCPPVETPILVQSQGSLPESTAHSGPAQCDSRQTVPSPSGHSNGMVRSPGSIQSDLSQVAPSQTGPVCDKVQLQAIPVCVPSPRPQGVGCGCLKPILGQSGSVCLSSDSSVDKYPDQSSQSSLQEDDNSNSGVAQHALVLGPGGNVLSNTDVPSKSPRSLDSAIQRQSSQRSTKPEPSCLAPRAKNIREQGFSDQVAKRIEAPQRRSTRSVYEAKWTVFVQWCKAHKVDFHSPSVEQIAEFLLHLFQEKKLQPSTIDGYRSAIADKVGNLTMNISRNENLNRLLDSFHRDRPKGRRGVPSWNLSLVLHQLMKPPFEPLRKASLKHVTFKTVFLLALGSGKRRSEIHAWVNRNIRHQSDWSKVSPLLLAFCPKTN